MNIAIILAAGGSTRLSQPKQLIQWNGRRLLQHVIEQLTQSGADRVIVVLGAFQQRIYNSLMVTGPNQIEIVVNDDWTRGQASSLATAIAYIVPELRDEDVVLVTVCDAPLISIDHYGRLYEAVILRHFYSAATAYKNGPGVPACFSSAAILSLTELAGDVGAKQWLRNQPIESIKVLRCPEAENDIDRLEDLRHLFPISTEPGVAVIHPIRKPELGRRPGWYQ